MQNVKLIKNSSIYCYESAMATVTNWFGRDYHMIFTEMIGFEYHPDKGDKKSRLNSEYCLDDLIQSLEKYHGVSVIKYQVHNQIIKVIQEDIDNDSPVMAFILPKNCEWTEEKNDRIFFLIINYDENGFWGYDLHSDTDKLFFISKDVMIENYKEQSEVYRFKCIHLESQINFETIKEVLVRRGYNKSSKFDMMRRFADDLHIVVKEELVYERSLDFRYVNVLNVLAHIVRGRKLFADACYHIAQTCNDEFAHYIGDCYTEVGEKWNSVWRLLAKAFVLNKGRLSSRLESTIEQVSQDILNIADVEEQIIHNIFVEKIIQSQMIRSSNNCQIADDEMIFDIDISDYFNIKGFQDEDGVIADMTGQGECFLNENIKDDRCIRFEDIEFVIKKGLDNFVCNGQEIDFPKNIYNRILILGCAEWGSGSGIVEAKGDLSNTRLNLEMQDWFFCQMNESNIWKGKATDYQNNIVERGLFCLNYNFGEPRMIDKLCFPSISNVHIFGIKLIKKK